MMAAHKDMPASKDTRGWTVEDERAAVVLFLKQEGSDARHAQERATKNTDKLYRMGGKDALLLAAEAIDRGYHADAALSKAEGAAG